MVNIAFATGGEGKEATSKSTQPQQQGDKKRSDDDIIPQSLEDGMEEQDFQSVDSTEDDSVSKYNFIFYFLYKLKYNESEEVEALF